MGRPLSITLSGMTLMQYLRKKETFVWGLLILMTILAWVFGSNNINSVTGSADNIAAIVLTLAFFKVRLVLMYFMEAGSAPWALRGILEAWLIITFSLVIFFYITGGEMLVAPFVR